MRETNEEKGIFNFIVRIFNEESPKLIDKSELSERYQELYDKSLFMGIGTAVTFVMGKGDSLSMADRIGLSQGKIPEHCTQEGFERLLKSFPHLEKDEDEYNFSQCWFLGGIKEAIAFMERELNK
ncbi:MAG TPA: hypothetical protein HPP87_10995 [Planctomycetes bacterium]|nr:hypothetical protein [Planctomycetota bacterium]